MSNKRSLIKGAYYLKCPVLKGRSYFWKVVDYNVVEDPKENDEIGLLGFDFNLFDADEGGEGGEDKD